MTLYRIKRTYTNNKGEEKTTTDFFLKVEGIVEPIQVDPHSYGDKGTSYGSMKMVSVYVKSKQDIK